MLHSPKTSNHLRNGDPLEIEDKGKSFTSLEIEILFISNGFLTDMPMKPTVSVKLGKFYCTQ